MSGRTDTGISDQAVRQQLDRIVGSGEFSGSKQLCIFLRFVVEETLAGRQEEIKAYTIGVQAFGKPDSFNPQLDPFVRGLASRLRRGLERYYHGEGRTDPIVISVPKGRYVPEFNLSRAEPGRHGRETERLVASEQVRNDRGNRKEFQPQISIAFFRWCMTTRKGLAGIGMAVIGLCWLLLVANPELDSATPVKDARPQLIVLPFTNLSPEAGKEELLDNLVRELSNRFTRFPGFSVISYYSAKVLIQRGGDRYETLRKLGIDYVVTGSFRLEDSVMQISAELVELESNRQLWGNRYQTPIIPENIFAAEEEIIRSIVGQLGGEYGVIQRKGQFSVGQSDASLEIFSAISLFRRYEFAPSLTSYQRAFDALRAAIETDQGNARAWAMLANLYFDGYALGLTEQGHGSFENGKKCLEKALALDSMDPFIRSMEGFMYQLSGDYRRSVIALKEAVSLNPNDGFLVGVAGWQLILLGEVELGRKYLQEGIQLNPFYPPYFHSAYGLMAYARGDYQTALQEAAKITLPELFWDPLFHTIALVGLGRMEEAGRQYERIIQLQPRFEKEKEFFVRCYIGNQDLVARILTDLEKAAAIVK